MHDLGTLAYGDCSMRVIGTPILEKLKRRHGDVMGATDAWLAEAKSADWSTPQDIKNRYAHASFLSDNRVVFNLRGNNYRLVVTVAYRTKTVLIERAGTHSEYRTWRLG